MLNRLLREIGGYESSNGVCGNGGHGNGNSHGNGCSSGVASGLEAYGARESGLSGSYTKMNSQFDSYGKNLHTGYDSYGGALRDAQRAEYEMFGSGNKSNNCPKNFSAFNNNYNNSSCQHKTHNCSANNSRNQTYVDYSRSEPNSSKSKHSNRSSKPDSCAKQIYKCSCDPCSMCCCCQKAQKRKKRNNVSKKKEWNSGMSSNDSASGCSASNPPNYFKPKYPSKNSFGCLDKQKNKTNCTKKSDKIYKQKNDCNCCFDMLQKKCCEMCCSQKEDSDCNNSKGRSSRCKCSGKSKEVGKQMFLCDCRPKKSGIVCCCHKLDSSCGEDIARLNRKNKKKQDCNCCQCKASKRNESRRSCLKNNDYNKHKNCSCPSDDEYKKACQAYAKANKEYKACLKCCSKNKQSLESACETTDCENESSTFSSTSCDDIFDDDDEDDNYGEYGCGRKMNGCNCFQNKFSTKTDYARNCQQSARKKQFEYSNCGDCHSSPQIKSRYTKTNCSENGSDIFDELETCLKDVSLTLRVIKNKHNLGSACQGKYDEVDEESGSESGGNSSDYSKKKSCCNRKSKSRLDGGKINEKNGLDCLLDLPLEGLEGITSNYTLKLNDADLKNKRTYAPPRKQDREGCYKTCCDPERDSYLFELCTKQAHEPKGDSVKIELQVPKATGAKATGTKASEICMRQTQIKPSRLDRRVSGCRLRRKPDPSEFRPSKLTLKRYMQFLATHRLHN